MKQMLNTFLRVAAQYIAAIALSYALRLGYFMPYPAALSEVLGGELNAVLLTAITSAALGGLIALGLRRLYMSVVAARTQMCWNKKNKSASPVPARFSAAAPQCSRILRRSVGCVRKTNCRRPRRVCSLCRRARESPSSRRTGGCLSSFRASMDVSRSKSTWNKKGEMSYGKTDRSGHQYRRYDSS